MLQKVFCCKHTVCVSEIPSHPSAPLPLLQFPPEGLSHPSSPWAGEAGEALPGAPGAAHPQKDRGKLLPARNLLVAPTLRARARQ